MPSLKTSKTIRNDFHNFFLVAIRERIATDSWEDGKILKSRAAALLIAAAKVCFSLYD